MLADTLTAAALAVDDNGDGLLEILGTRLTGARVELALTSPFADVGAPFEAASTGSAGASGRTMSSPHG